MCKKIDMWMIDYASKSISDVKKRKSFKFQTLNVNLLVQNVQNFKKLP